MSKTVRNSHRINILPCDVVGNITLLRSRERACEPRSIGAQTIQRAWLFFADGLCVSTRSRWTTRTTGYTGPAGFTRPSRYSWTSGTRRTHRATWSKRRHWTAGSGRATGTSWTSRPTWTGRPTRSTRTNWTNRTTGTPGAARSTRPPRSTGTARSSRTTRTNWFTRGYRSTGTSGSSRPCWTNWATGTSRCYRSWRASVSSWDRVQHWNTHKKRRFPACSIHCFHPNRHKLFTAIQRTTELRRNFGEVSPGHSCYVLSYHF